MAEPIENPTPSPPPTESVAIKILKGGYVATLLVAKEVTTFPTIKQVHLAIERAKVNYGIDDRVVEKLVMQEIKGKPLVFAKGKPPVAGGAARLIWNAVKNDGDESKDVIEEPPQFMPQRHYFSRVEKGDRILSRLPPTEGTRGINVYGESIAAAGDDVPLPQGEGTYPSKDGLSLLAAVDGVASWSGEHVLVSEVTHIDGSVDTQTGDLKIEGSLHIEKDVRAGFKVEAIGDIYIGGNIEGAVVYSRSGSVVVRNGILGQSRARILAGQDIVAGFIQDATIGAKQDVKVDRYIINSSVTAGHYILAMANEGIVRGGSLFAEKKIEANVVGSNSLIETDLRVGYTPPENVSRARYLLGSDQRRNRTDLAYVQKRLAFLQLLKERMGNLTEEKELQLAELEKKENILLHQQRAHIEQEDELDSSREVEMNITAEAESIRVHQTIYPDVRVAIGDVAIEINKARQNIMFFRVGEKVSFGPLRQAVTPNKARGK
ncbi:MAG: DUF342 domain-containing protein [Candidatus Marinimicrobia bacterium]|nr:DUF342 domain-containing protein [Candidatus Neomarinimicrobiota bacterium]